MITLDTLSSSTSGTLDFRCHRNLYYLDSIGTAIGCNEKRRENKSRAIRIGQIKNGAIRI
jgi:hypothetical protein